MGSKGSLLHHECLYHAAQPGLLKGQAARQQFCKRVDLLQVAVLSRKLLQPGPHLFVNEGSLLLRGQEMEHYTHGRILDHAPPRKEVEAWEQVCITQSPQHFTGRRGCALYRTIG